MASASFLDRPLEEAGTLHEAFIDWPMASCRFVHPKTTGHSSSKVDSKNAGTRQNSSTRKTVEEDLPSAQHTEDINIVI